MGRPFLVNLFSKLTLVGLKLNLPIKWIIKKTIFRQFCGGETIVECTEPFEFLKAQNVEAILDYSVEGQEDEEAFEETKEELLSLIANAKNHAKDPTTCLKVTGLASSYILEKYGSNDGLEGSDMAEWAKVLDRIEQICQKAHDLGVKVYVDAEDSWFQKAIDDVAEAMILKYNSERAIVFTTTQLYRHDRLVYLKRLIEMCRAQGKFLGVKLVRGAYMEKENERARERGYPTPIQPDKEATDRDYNLALTTVVENIDIVEVCAGTHNAESCQLLASLIHEKGLPRNHKNIFFSQLFGMSDNLSFVLAGNGYNVSKYLPYGPVKATVPYLIRRAEENTAIAGQMGKELKLALKEKRRRRSK